MWTQAAALNRPPGSRGSRHDRIPCSHSPPTTAAPSNLDVGVEGAHRLVARCQESLEQPRLERRRHLSDVIDRGHAMELATLNSEILGVRHVEWLVFRTDRTRRVVDN